MYVCTIVYREREIACNLHGCRISLVFGCEIPIFAGENRRKQTNTSIFVHEIPIDSPLSFLKPLCQTWMKRSICKTHSSRKCWENTGNLEVSCWENHWKNWKKPWKNNPQMIILRSQFPHWRRLQAKLPSHRALRIRTLLGRLPATRGGWAARTELR